MIKLERAFTPLCLIPSEVARLTEDYRERGNSVWNIDELKRALLETSFEKCAYCECALTRESKYMEVDHFRDKVRNPNSVVEWSNLIPSCRRCNASKGDHDVVEEPIIDPYQIDPRSHIGFRLYRFYAKSVLGRNTLDVLNLNHPERAVRARFEVGEGLQASIDGAVEKWERHQREQNARSRNRLLSHLERLLTECIPPASYAATSATILHTDDDYGLLVRDLKLAQLWNEELQSLHVRSEAIALIGP